MELNYTPNQSAAGLDNNTRIEEESHRTVSCNVVIFGETGAGKSSLVNLIVGAKTAPTSSYTMGCTTKTNVYKHNIVIQDKILQVKLFDTAGQWGPLLLVGVT